MVLRFKLKIMSPKHAKNYIFWVKTTCLPHRTKLHKKPSKTCTNWLNSLQLLINKDYMLTTMTKSMYQVKQMFFQSLKTLSSCRIYILLSILYN